MRFGYLSCLVLLAIIFAGCTTVSDPYDQLHGSTLAPRYTNTSQLICQGMNVTLPCYCMFCQNETTWSNEILALFFDYFDGTLKGGTCRFELCNGTTFNETLEGSSDTQARVFAIGQGPSFISTDAANIYCKHSLQIATKWMKSVDGPPMVPNQSRAVCWLERNVLPVYIYYTGGNNIDQMRTREIAQEFGRSPGTGLTGAGPVIVTTELSLNSSNATQIQAVKDQIVEYKDFCPKCKIVLAMGSNDTRALQMVLEDPSIPPRTGLNYSEMVDMVGFGFRANDYVNCSPEKIIGDNYMFSRYILTKYSKPSIWLYVGASEGPSIDASCVWDGVSVHKFYSTLFSMTQALASSGVIGMSFYEYVDGTGPLPCNGIQGCGFGVADKEPEMSTWSSLCSYYGEAQYRPPIIFSRNGQGAQCDFFQNTKQFNKLSVEINPEPGQLTELLEPELGLHLGCGEVCVADHPVPNSDIYNNVLGTGFTHCNTPGDPFSYPVIDEWADSLDISGNFMRALFEQVNPAYDYQKVSCTAMSDMTCNPLNLTMAQICSGGIANCPAGLSCGSGEKPCAFGLAQCKEYPGVRYPDPSNLPPDVAKCGGLGYNPFNVSSSVCCGSNKFKRFLNISQTFLSDYWAFLSFCPSTMTDADLPWAQYYLAAFMYNNSTFDQVQEPPSIFDYIVVRNPFGTDCAAGPNNHYITYTRNYVSNFSANVTTRYFAALFLCGSNCVDCCGEGSGFPFIPETPAETTPYFLSLNMLGGGAGSVTINGTTCTASCSVPVAPNQAVALIIEPGADSVFAGWSGECTGFGECIVNMSSNKSVAVAFSSVSAADYALQVKIGGTGSGTVNGTKISCPLECSAPYPTGTIVTLKAIPSKIAIKSPSPSDPTMPIIVEPFVSSVFAGWSGACTGNNSDCTITMSSDKFVTAIFSPSSYPTADNTTSVDILPP